MRGLIIGGANCVADDIARALALFRPDAIVALNDQIADYDGIIDYGASLHPEKWESWIEARTQRQCYAPQYWSHVNYSQRVKRIPDRTIGHNGGSSAMLGVRLLCAEGFDRIVLAGCPLERRPHYFDAKEWQEADSFRKAWRDQFEILKPCVRSMSGYTKKLLGEPTSDWLA